MKNMLVRALEDNAREYVDLVQRRLNGYLDDTDELWYVDNDDENIDLIAEMRNMSTKDMVVLGMYHDYNPSADFVNSNLEVVSAEQLAQLYIDNIEDIWELLSDSDKEYIVNELTELTRNEDSISYYIVGPEEEIDSLISIAEDIAVKKVTGDKKALLTREKGGAKISHKFGCLYVVKDADDKDNLMKVRKEVGEYGTWLRYYYPNGDEELVYMSV
jgi:hypothetical protein